MIMMAILQNISNNSSVLRNNNNDDDDDYYYYYYYFFLPSVSMIPRDFGKKLSEIQNVGVTITPGSPRG